MRSIRLASTGLLLLVSGCAGRSEEHGPLPDPVVVQREIDETIANHVVHLKAGDAGRAATVYTEDVLVRPAGAPPVQGRPAMETFMANVFAGHSIAEARYDTEELSVYADTAWVFGSYTWEMRPTTGGESVTDRGDYLVKWARQPDGTWRIHRNIFNSYATPGDGP